MALWNDILEWSVSELRPWQQDALRRLFHNDCKLSEADLEELYCLMKAEHGLSSESPKKLKPRPLAEEHMPAQSGSSHKVALTRLYDLEHVNRLASGQTLEFDPDGLTIVFGGNGSGKSGYSRVLKRACRARDIHERVHPNASDPTAATKVPNAKFDLLTGKASNTVFWQHDKSPPDELSSIAVFDSRCARVFLDAEREAAFLPYGLDIVQALGQVAYASLTKTLKGEIAGQDKLIQQYQEVEQLVRDDTKTGKTVAAAIEKQDSKQLHDLSKLDEAEAARHSEIQRALKEADPAAKAKVHQGAAKRIAAFTERLKQRVATVGVQIVEDAQRVDENFVAIEAANKLAINKFQAGEELLAGTGDYAWKKLFEAAELFSTTAAYKDHVFPHVGVGAKCVLCQRLLDQDSAKRLTRFHDFVQDTTTTQLKTAAAERTALIEGIANANLNFGLDEALEEELAALDGTAVKRIKAYQAACQARQKWLGDAFKAHSWKDCPALTADPVPALEKLSSKQAAEATALVSASGEKGRAQLAAEYAEYEAKHRLRVNLKQILALVEARKVRGILKKCERSLNTLAVSNKAKELTSKAVTKDLRKALDEEFLALGIQHIKTELKEKGKAGKTLHKLVLKLPTELPLNEVLSEGEQRAIAIASFLAELRTAAHVSGIVFDDPVSSLDHNNRAIVARRLAAESKTRQVIIFTHDVVFLNDLQTEAERQKVATKVCHLDWADGNPGCVKGDLPWEQSRWNARIGSIRQVQQGLSNKWSPHPTDAQRKTMREQYSLLRATCERVVETVYFNNVIGRFRGYVDVGKLPSVGWLSNQHCDDLHTLWKRCHEVVSAHDPASAAHKAIPTPTDLATDLDQLEALVAAVQAARPKK